MVKEVEEVTSKKQIRDKYKVIHQLAHKHSITVLCKIAICHQKYKGIYGYKRVTIWLKREHKLTVNHKRVYRLMKELGIKAKIRKRKPGYFKSKDSVVSDNLLNRDFKADKQNKKWVTDITYLIFGKYRLYLSVILDLFNNEVIAFKISNKNDIDLVANTVKLAKIKRDTRGVILQFQYTSRRYNNLIKANNMSVSMPRKGNCLDNACIESFFGHLKSELFHFKNFNNAKEVISAVKRYIHFYNNDRFQSKLNNLTPIE